MARKLGWLVIVAALALPAAAGELGKVSGYVKDSAGVAQMGAMVEVYGPGSATRTLFTDPHGFYSLAGLAAGMYQIKVTAPSFLPSLRENVHVRSGASLLVNVTLSTLFEALQLVPARNAQSEEDEDWKWTLRSMSNRPVLRVLDDGPLVVVSKTDDSGDKTLKARVAFMAGADSDGLDSTAGMTTAFSIERSMFGAGTMALDGSVAQSSDGIMPSAVVRMAYSHRLPDGSEPNVSLTMRRLSTPELSLHNAGLQALALSLSNSFSFGNALEVNVGTEFQTIQLANRVGSVYPFGTATFHVSPNTVVEYGFATFEPNMRGAKGFESAPADLSESGPRVSMANWSPVMEHASHHEISVSRRVGANKMQLAVYSDHLKDPALTGTGDADLDSGAFLSDFSAGTFTYTGRDMSARGIRAVYERKLNSNVTATLDYAYGGVLDLAPWVSVDDARAAMAIKRRHALGYKMAGTLPWCKGKWIASYRWTSGSALTPVDLFNAGPGQSDPFLSFFLRQPIPSMPGHMEALVDVRNLMAQGYVPVVGQDGHTLYLVQSARAVRGGVSFTF
jgi:hypothetical protein